MVAEKNQLAPSDVRGLALRSKRAIQQFVNTGSGLQALASFIFPAGFMGMGINSGSWLGGWSSIEPRDFPYENVNAFNSSIVMACHNWISGAFKEAKPLVYRLKDDGTEQELPNHRLVKLLRRPNPYYSYSKLMGATLLSYNLDGNGYVFKERADGGYGQTRALYYIPHYMIEPIRDSGDAYISYYRYTVDGVQYRIPPDRIIHFKYDLDPYNTLKGRKILQPVFSMIFADEEADSFTAALLKNTAIPGVIISPKDETVKVEPDDAEAIKESYKRKFGGDNRGEPLVTNFAARVSLLGFSPKDLDLKENRRLPEERVAAQYRIPPVVAGLGAGLDKSTYSNYEQAERHGYESCIAPMWEEFAEEWTNRLLPEFTSGSDEYVVRYDTSKIKALRESVNEIATRTVKLYQVDGIDRAELRIDNGYTVDEARDRNVFYSSTRPKTVPPPPGTQPGIAAPKGRRGLVSKVREMLQLKGAPQANLDTAYGMSLEGDVSSTVETMQRELSGLFSDMGREARKAGAAVDTFNPEAETERILGDVLTGAAVAAVIAAIWSSMGEDIEDTARITVSLRLGLPLEDVWNDSTAATAASQLKRYAASYEDAIRAQSKAAILEAIKAAQDGESAAQIARRIKGMVEGRSLYPGIYKEAYAKAKAAKATNEQAERAGDSAAKRYRANLIAEAETRTYQNVAVLESLNTSGRVAKVKVIDGSECGWKYHDDTDRANNTTRSLEEARRYPVVHPRCKRRFYPVED